MPLLHEGHERISRDGTLPPDELRMIELACFMDSLPSDYFRYYYFKDEILAELQAKPTTRAQDIMASVPDYWAHYREQAARDVPELDPDHSRGGIHELELAIDVMDAIYNDRREVWYVNVPNCGSIADFPDDLVVETIGYVDATVSPLLYRAIYRDKYVGWCRCWANTRLWLLRLPGVAIAGMPSAR